MAKENDLTDGQWDVILKGRFDALQLYLAATPKPAKANEKPIKSE